MTSTLPDNPWAVAVGTFVLAFGDIEQTTIALLGCLPECQIPKTAPHLDLGRRFQILKEVLERSEDEDYVATLTTMKVVESLLQERNLLAHNGLWFDFYKDGDQILIRSSIVSSRNRAKRLDLKQAEALAIQAYKCAADFSSAAVSLMRSVYTDDDN